MKRINIISLFLLLLNYQQQIDASTTNDTPQNAAKNFQKFVSTCSGTRDVYDDHGGSAGFTSNCRIEVWSGNDVSDLSEFKDLSAEQQEKIKAELKGQEGQPTAPQENNLDHIKLLAEEASNRHYMCMEAKRSILDQLKAQLPAGLNSCEKITQALNDLKVSPLLETFINKVNGPMKEIVARIRVLEEDTQMPEADKREAIRKEKSQLTMLLDEDCKDDHPSIRFHNVGYLPGPDLAKAKMTLLVTHPDRKTEFFNLPVESMGSHADILRAIADAAALHGSRGNFGSYEARYLPGGQGAYMSGGPAVISFIPSSAAKLTKDENIIDGLKASIKVDQDCKGDSNTGSMPVIQPVNGNNDPQVIFGNTAPKPSSENKTTQSTVENTTPNPVEENKNSSVNAAAVPLKESGINKFINQVSNINDPSQIETEVSSAFKDLFDNNFIDLIPNVRFIDVFYPSKSAERKKIKKKKEKKKDLLSEVVKRLETLRYGYVNDVKRIGTALIKEADETAKKDLEPSKSNTSTVISEKDAAVNACAEKIIAANSQPFTFESVARKAFSDLFSNSILDNMSDVSFVDPFFNKKTEDRKNIKRRKEKKKVLLAEVVSALGKQNFINIEAIKRIGNELIEEVNKAEKDALIYADSANLDVNEAVATCLKTISDINDPNQDKTKVEESFKSLFDKDVLDKMSDVPFSDKIYYLRSKEGKEIINNEEKRKVLLKEVISRLKEARYTKYTEVESIGNELITTITKNANLAKSSTVGSFLRWLKGPEKEKN